MLLVWRWQISPRGAKPSVRTRKVCRKRDSKTVRFGLQLSNTQAAITATPMTQAAHHAPGVVTGRKTRATLNNVAFLVD